MNKKEATITITGIQHDVSDEITKNTYTGHYTFLNGMHVISYDEFLQDEGEAPIKNTNLIKINENSIHIRKKGPVTTQMHFEENNTHTGLYQTPFGTFDMSIETSKLSVNSSTDQVTSTIEYTLSLNHAPVSRCTIEIVVAL